MTHEEQRQSEDFTVAMLKLLGDPVGETVGSLCWTGVNRRWYKPPDRFRKASWDKAEGLDKGAEIE